MICEMCVYKENCQFLSKHKNAKIESCTAHKSGTVIEWHKIKTRPLTEEEKAEYEYIVMPDCIIDCEMPEDGQETLIATKYDTSIDVFHYDIDGSYFEDHDDWEDVLAWAELPKYEESETE